MHTNEVRDSKPWIVLEVLEKIAVVVGVPVFLWFASTVQRHDIQITRLETTIDEGIKQRFTNLERQNDRILREIATIRQQLNEQENTIRESK